MSYARQMLDTYPHFQAVHYAPNLISLKNGG